MTAARPARAAALQTVEWIVRPTALLRRAQARYGEPFTLRTAWSDAPLVLTSDPEEIKRVYAAPPDVLQGGDSCGVPRAVRGPQLGPDPARRRAPQTAPPDAAAVPRRGAQALDGTIAEITHARAGHVGRQRAAQDAPADAGDDARGHPARDLRQPRPRAASDALRSALDMTGSTPNLIAMSLVQRTRPAPAASSAAVERIDELIYARIDEAGGGDSILDLLKALRRDARGAARPARHAARRRPRDHRDRARLGARAARPPPRGHSTTDEQIDAVRQGGPAHPPRAQHHRPQDACSRTRSASYTLPQGVYVAACLVSRAPSPRTPPEFIPFGGGTRRCLGAAFATLEMREVLRAVSQRFTLDPTGPKGSGCAAAASSSRPPRRGSIIPLTR